MKKILLGSLILLLLCSCDNNKNTEIKNQTLENTTNEIDNMNVSEELKAWLNDIKTNKVLTIFCISTSKRCEKIKGSIDEITNVNKYIIMLDQLNDEEKSIYKSKFDIKDYTGYVPYLILSDKDKLINTKKNISDINDVKDFIK